MKDHLERLIQTVQETQLVEILMTADSLEERVKICEKARETPEFTEFKKHYDAEASKMDILVIDNVISSGDFTCTADKAVALAMILIIERINETDMFDEDSYHEFISSLRDVQGAQADIANAIADFLDVQLWMITDLRFEDWLKEIF